MEKNTSLQKYDAAPTTQTMYRITYMEMGDDYEQMDWYKNKEEAYRVFYDMVDNDMTDDGDIVDLHHVIFDTIEFDLESGSEHIVSSIIKIM
jgi:hypothetical protein